MITGMLPHQTTVSPCIGAVLLRAAQKDTAIVVTTTNAQFFPALTSIDKLIVLAFATQKTVLKKQNSLHTHTHTHTDGIQCWNNSPIVG